MKARTLMKFYKMRDEYDVLKCPRCGMVVKEAGTPVRGQHFALLTMHIGSIKCRAMAGDRPTCKCGCGTPVNWDPSRGRWRDYVDHHRSPELNEKIRKALMERGKEKSRKFFEKIRGYLPCTQSTLHEKIGLRKKLCSQAIKRLEKYGFIEREKVLYKSRWTYMLKEKK
jgi:endogenous inhibitor of DNA gyrase (YacG/DUF329 family)